MKNITKKEQIFKQENEWFDRIPGVIDFFEFLEVKIKEMVGIIINKAIDEEFRQFIGADPYERNENRRDHRSGFRKRSFETYRFGLIEDISIPKARKKSFFPSILKRWRRRETKIGKIITDIFIRGVSTRKLKPISKALFGKGYSATTISSFNRSIKEDILSWLNRKIERPISYLFLDAVNLKVKRHLISKEALLCAVGISPDGYKEFLGFILGGKESTQSWEDLILHLIRRGLDPKRVKLVIVDGNAGLLRAIDNLLPGIPVQRCLVHKIRNLWAHCPKSLKGIIPAEAKRIFYATSETEAKERFQAFKEKWIREVPKVVECLEKDYETIFTFYRFPYRHWEKIRTTNIIERAFREFRRRTFGFWIPFLLRNPV